MVHEHEPPHNNSCFPWKVWSVRPLLGQHCCLPCGPMERPRLRRRLIVPSAHDVRRTAMLVLLTLSAGCTQTACQPGVPDAPSVRIALVTPLNFGSVAGGTRYALTQQGGSAGLQCVFGHMPEHGPGQRCGGARGRPAGVHPWPCTCAHTLRHFAVQALHTRVRLPT